MPTEPFSEYLKRRRRELDLTQAEVTERGGLSQGYLSNLERSPSIGKARNPSRKMVPRIAQGLGVSIAEVEVAAGYQKGSITVPEVMFGDERIIVEGMTYKIIDTNGPIEITMSQDDIEFLAFWAKRKKKRQ